MVMQFGKICCFVLFVYQSVKTTDFFTLFLLILSQIFGATELTTKHILIFSQGTIDLEANLAKEIYVSYSQTVCNY